MVRCAILRGHRKQNSLPSHPLQLVFCFIHQIVERGVEALKILDKGNQSVVLARIVHHCHQQIIRLFHAVAVLKFNIVQIGGDNGLDKQFLSVLATVHMGAVQVRLASDGNFFGAILADFIVFLRGDMPELPIKGLAVGIKVISVIGGDAGGIPILAAFAMDISFFGIMTRLIRTNMIQVLKQDYIRASRAKGLSSVNVILRHGLKNILIPVLTRLVSIVIGFFCGSAVIESIFSIQGIGNLALKSVISKDTPVLQCFIFILAVGIVVLNFLVDIAYSAIDRRIQLK